MRKQQTEQEITQPPPGTPASVVRYNARRGEGVAVLVNSGRRVRIPWSAVKDANVVTLAPGELIRVRLDSHDPGRVESLVVPDP